MYLAAVLFAAGCVTSSQPTEHGETVAARDEAIRLPLDESVRGNIHCDAGACARWYRVRVEEPGELRVEVHAPSGPDIPDFDARLEDANGEVLWGDAPTGHTPRKIERMLGPGDYYLVIESEGMLRGPLGYSAVARVEAAGSVLRTPGATAAKRRPRAQPRRPEIWMGAEILEVEGRAGLPTVILLDAGSRDDWRVGLRGELLNAGAVIATFSLVEVAESYSRARLDDAPNDTVTFETRARVRVPLE